MSVTDPEGVSILCLLVCMEEYPFYVTYVPDGVPILSLGVPEGVPILCLLVHLMEFPFS
jgi:hypothetical protein